MQSGCHLPTRADPEMPLNPLPTPDVSAVDINALVDVFGPTISAEATGLSTGFTPPPFKDKVISPTTRNITPEGLPMEAEPHPSELPKFSQTMSQAVSQTERAQALRQLLQPPAQEEDFPYTPLPSYQPPGPAEAAVANHICPNEGHFPSVVIPIQHALEGISMEQLAGVMASPNNFLILVFFLGGQNHFNMHKDLLLITQTKFREIFQDDGITLIASVRSEGTSFPSSKFSPPISHFITGLKPHVRAFLLAYKAIGISNTIVFHILSLGDNMISWTIGIYKTPILDDNAAPNQIRDAITRSTFDDSTFRRIIAPTRPPNSHMDT